MIRGSDGLDYENLTEKLLGNPAGTRYNARIQSHRARGLPKDEQDLWIAAYDAEFGRLVALGRSEGRDFIDWQASDVANNALSTHYFARAELAAQSRSSSG